MLTIKCAKCNAKLMKYQKIGNGKVLRCFKDRIVKDYTIKKDNLILCPHCSNVIGIDKGNLIKMNQGSFTYSGTKNC